MLKFLLKYALFFVLFFISVEGYAQAVKPNRQPIVTRIDTGKIVPAKFDKEAINNYKDQKEFQYDELQVSQLSLWDRFWMWIWNLVGKIFVGVASNSIAKYFFIGLGIAIVLYLVIKAIGAESIFSKKSKDAILAYDVITENIHEIDYEQELKRLISENKYRLAVRLLYLQALKKLSDANLIQWEQDKTNYNYLRELSKPELKNDFSKLTLQFDYIWYGDFPVDAAKFEPINQSFIQFNKQIK